MEFYQDQSYNEMKAEQYEAGHRLNLGDCAERITLIVGRYNSKWLNEGRRDELIKFSPTFIL
jgi:hypothetical protein